jgi:hypothetical protein
VASNRWFEYRLYVWDVAVNGISYTNTWLCFDVRRERYYIRCTYHKPLSSENYIENGKERMYFGSSTWYVYKQSTYIDNINSDDWHEIDYFFITNVLDFWAPQTVKHSPHIYLYTHNCANMKYVIDTEHSNEFNVWRGQISSSNLYDNELYVTANRIAIKFYWKDDDKPFEFEGFIIEIDWLENVLTK